ncbi:protein-L-isoaspartate(D-aspartate) O-methyltransferase [Candidatus Protofrankia californiensis]|uniref:Protein-L-isoaspartate O-methyltransferase n=1 Tax=Candidatus Protofrankia californiensis TaxID=1839754 RepID=A0A1C3P3E7_9ACTN|nr:protein-L-isoaspartate(D-aspartate) O-methyltransferase [Candidatus Protofrankia californiensis]
MRAVARHLFVPEVPVEKAYAAEHHYVTKKDEHGVSISSVSAARIQVMMLEQAEVRPGMRVLEIGTGGYNAALLAELVGEGGAVISIDIDQDVLDRARRFLPAAGYGSVTLLRADGEFGAPEHAPFDRIIVTAGAWDIPPAWVEQLAGGGRIVVPLRMRGLTRSVAFEWNNGQLADRGYELCGFVPMQGAGEQRERLIPLHGDDVRLRLDDNQQADGDALRAALSMPRREAWSGTAVGKDIRFDGLYLWMAMRLPDFGLLAATKAAVDRGLVAHSWGLGVPTLLDGDSFAYLTFRATSEAREQFEFGAYGHGPHADVTVEKLVSLIRSWDGTSLGARISAFPAGTPDELLPSDALILARRHTRIAITWPSPPPKLAALPARRAAPNGSNDRK